jgi:hypothetical protein
MQKTLLILFFLISIPCSYAETAINGYSLIAQGKTKEGLILLEDSFQNMKKEDKANASFILAQAEAGTLKNSAAYYAKYSLKYTPNLDEISKAKLQRLLGDELFASGAVDQAIEAYEKGLEIGKGDAGLSFYIRYKLGWAYVNRNKYEKVFSLWSQHLMTENVLSTSYIHDYAKFWMEHTLKENKISEIPSFPIKDLSHFTKGITEGFEREYQKKNQLKQLLKHAPTTKEKSLFLVGLLPYKGISSCEKILLLNTAEGVEKIYFDEATLKPVLDECLEISLKTNNLLQLEALEKIYDQLSLGLTERAILKIHKKDAKKACLIFLEIFETSEETFALNLAINEHGPLGCFQDGVYLDKLVKLTDSKLKKWPKDPLQLLLRQEVFAVAFSKDLPPNWASNSSPIKQDLLHGLEGQIEYAPYYKGFYQDQQSLLRHFHKSTDPEAITEFIAKTNDLSDFVVAELRLLIGLKSGNLESVQKLVKGCKAFSDHGTQLVVNYIIEQKLKGLFFDNILCFLRESISEEQKLEMVILGPAPTPINEPFLNYVNEILYSADFKENRDFDKRLKDNYKSIFTFKEVKVSLGQFKSFKMNQIPLWDKKVLQARNLILKAEWMNDDLKTLMISFFNNALDEAINRLNQFTLQENEKRLLSTRYEGLKFK